MEWHYMEFDDWHRPLGNQAFLVYPPSMQRSEISEYSKAVEKESVYAQAYAVAYNLQGLASSREKHYDQAISLYRKALDISPKFASANNNLAWLYATASEGRFWNGKKAVEYARAACELTEWKNPTCLDTLAAAYARIGDFENAIKWQEKALELAGKTKRADAQQRLDLYRMRKPWPAN
jgi:tetratricopeptide (TPR) repeat protein